MLLTVKVVAEESGVVEVVVTLVLVGDVDEVEFVGLLEVRDEEVVMAVEATPLVPVATGWLGSIAKEKWNNSSPASPTTITMGTAARATGSTLSLFPLNLEDLRSTVAAKVIGAWREST